MVNGVYGYSGQDIYRQQAQRRAAEWAQRSAAQLQAAQGQQAEFDCDICFYITRSCCRVNV